MKTLSVLLDAAGAIGILFVLLAVLAFILIIFIIKRYRRCPSDKLLVVFGKIGRDKGEKRAAKVIHGGAAFIWPIIQDYEYIDLTPIPIIVDLKGALSKQNIRVNIPARFMVGISTEPGVMENAAERLLGLTLQQVHDLSADIIFGQLRVVIATMKIEEINSDREKFLANVTDAVEHELKKIGLKLINVNVTDITDDNGYIDALGKEATSHAINEARKIVAEKERDGSIGEANAKQEQRVKVAEANAQAVEGENLAQITIARSESEKRVQMSQALKEAEIAEKTNQAQARKASYLAEKEAELARAERENATQQANIIVPQKIEKEKIEIAAEAEAERLRRVAKGQADAKYAEMDAMARGTFEILSKQAEGFKMIVNAANNDANSAVRLLIADKLEKLVGAQVEAIKNIKIDKVTVWDSGSSDGKSSTANFIKNMAGSIPPMQELFNMAGMNLPEYLGKLKDEKEEEMEK